MQSHSPHSALDARLIAEAAEMIRVIGHPVRLRLAEALESGERGVSDLQKAVGAPQAFVSQQLARMRAARIVTCRRDGMRMLYSLADGRVLQILECLRDCEARVRGRAPANTGRER